MGAECDILDLLDFGRQMSIKQLFPEAIAAFEGALRISREREPRASRSLELRVLLALIRALERADREAGAGTEARSAALQEEVTSMLDGDPRLSAVDRARGWAELGELAFLRSRWSRVVDCYARSLGETIDEQPEAIRWMRAWTWNGYAFALLCVGKAEEAFSASERGRAFIPSRHPRDKRLLSETATLHEATALLLLRRFSEAVEILERLEPSLREGLFQREVRGALAFAKAGTICRLDERGVLVAVTSDDPPSGSAP